MRIIITSFLLLISVVAAATPASTIYQEDTLITVVNDTANLVAVQSDPAASPALLQGGNVIDPTISNGFTLMTDRKSVV